MVDYTQITYKICYTGLKGKRVCKFYHNKKPLLNKYKKEKDNNPIMYFYNNGKWIGYDRLME